LFAIKMTRSKSQSLSKKRKRERKKAKVGTAAHFLTRSQSLKKLQISLKDFRRLCILKGVFPREPRKKFKGRSKTYYYVKDIKMLAHEPVLHKFRDLKVWIKRLNKAMGRREETRTTHLIENKPKYHLDHIVKERYPTFLDALRDLDDALCLVQFFAHLPGVTGVPVERVQTCQRIMREFHFAVSKLHALRKAFLSVKGIYYQAEIMGQRITWISPYEFTQPVTSDVDYRIMLTFLQFYEVLMHFVNVKIFHHLGLKYPPDVSQAMDEDDYSLFAILGRRAVEDSIHAFQKPDGKEASELEGKLSQRKKEELEERIREIGEREMKESHTSEDGDHEEGDEEEDDEDAEIDMDDFEESDEDDEEDEEDEEEDGR
jgi:pescadillo